MSSDARWPAERSHPGWRRLWAATSVTDTIHAIDPGTLGEYVLVLAERGLEAARQGFPEVAEHLDTGCGDCQAQVADMAGFADEVRAERARARTDNSPLANLTRLVATLLGPSSQPAGLPAGVRAAGEKPATQTYGVGPYTISLRVVPPTRRAATDSMQLHGLVIADNTPATSLAGSTARLSRRGEALHTASLDRYGGFVFDRLVSGTYTLEVQIEDQQVVVEDFTIGV